MNPSASERAAVDGMRKAAFRYSKWPTQAITYFLGKAEILALREECRRIEGPGFSEKRFHEEFLSEGQIPPALFRARLLARARARVRDGRPRGDGSGAFAMSAGADESPALRALDDFVAAARAALGNDLASAVLFGSAAEGALRPESDVNLVLVLRTFPASGVDALRGALRFAQAASRLEVMFLLESEIPDAAEAFAVKFADIARRRRVLFGADPFAALRSLRTRFAGDSHSRC